jgi:hypothetical protein
MGREGQKDGNLGGWDHPGHTSLGINDRPEVMLLETTSVLSDGAESSSPPQRAHQLIVFFIYQKKKNVPLLDWTCWLGMVWGAPSLGVQSDGRWYRVQPGSQWAGQRPQHTKTKESSWQACKPWNMVMGVSRVCGRPRAAVRHGGHTVSNVYAEVCSPSAQTSRPLDAGLAAAVDMNRVRKLVWRRGTWASGCRVSDAWMGR